MPPWSVSPPTTLLFVNNMRIWVWNVSSQQRLSQAFCALLRTLRKLSKIKKIFFFFACPKKKQKKTPTNDNSPFVGYSYVQRLYYCEFNFSNSILKFIAVCFFFSPIKLKAALIRTGSSGRAWFLPVPIFSGFLFIKKKKNTG